MVTGCSLCVVTCMPSYAYESYAVQLEHVFLSACQLNGLSTGELSHHEQLHASVLLWLPDSCVACTPALPCHIHLRCPCRLKQTVCHHASGPNTILEESNMAKPSSAFAAKLPALEALGPLAQLRGSLGRCDQVALHRALTDPATVERRPHCPAFQGSMSFQSARGTFAQASQQIQQMN